MKIFSHLLEKYVKNHEVAYNSGATPEFDRTLQISGS
jgi:hypothetical protein